jgi:hypothetical protein
LQKALLDYLPEEPTKKSLLDGIREKLTRAISR